MAHEDWIQARIDQVAELMDVGCGLETIVQILNTDGFMRIYNGKNVTEDFVFDACVSILKKRWEAKQKIEEDFDVSDEGFDPYSNCYTDDC